MIRRNAAIAVGLAGLGLAACTTPIVASVDTRTTLDAAKVLGDDSSAAARFDIVNSARPVIEYGLAKTRFVIKISAAGGATEKDEPSDKVVVNNSLSVVGGTEKPISPKKDEEAKPLETEAAWCAALRKQYNIDRLTVMSAVVAKQRTDVFVAGFPAGALAMSEKVAGAKAVQDYAVIYKKAAAAALSADSALDTIISTCPFALKAELTATTELDPTRTFTLYSLGSDFSSDKLTAELEGGYFKSVSGTGEDATADILVGGVKSIATLAWTPSKLMAAAPRTEAQLTKLEATLKALAPVKNVDRMKLLAALAEMIPPGQPEVIDPKLPFTVAIDVSSVGSTTRAIPFRADLGVTGSVNCSTRAGGVVAASDTPTLVGVALSSARACLIEVSKDDVSLGRLQAWASDASQITVVPINRTTFITTTTTYGFTGGALTKTEVSRPSPAREVVGVVPSLFSALFSTKAGNARAQADLTKARTEEIEAQTARLKAAKDLQATRKDEPSDEK